MRRIARRLAVLAIMGSLLASLASPLGAHELESGRLTIIQRAPAHLELVFRIDEVPALKGVLAPDATVPGFLLSMAAMSDADFDRAVEGGRARFASEVTLKDAAGRPLALRNWRWPDRAALRKRMREQAMGIMVGGAAHAHDGGAEIRVDALAGSPVSSVSVRLPRSLGEVTVVSYRPVQQRHRAGEGGSLQVHF